MDQKTREELIRLLPRLRRFAFGLTGTVPDADDLVQSACERALNRSHQWTPGTRLDSWMFYIIKNIHIDELRKHKLRGDPVDTNDYHQVVDIKDHSRTESYSNLKQVAAAMEHLPEDQRVILLLVCVEEYTYREAAAILEIPIGTVMSRLARARVNLNEQLGC